MSDRDEKCGACAWWRVQWEGEFRGDCRRRSPGAPLLVVMSRHDLDHTEAQWPRTDREDWCGDFQPSPASLSARASTPDSPNPEATP